jgi:hypothetical protein
VVSIYEHYHANYFSVFFLSVFFQTYLKAAQTWDEGPKNGESSKKPFEEEEEDETTLPLIWVLGL